MATPPTLRQRRFRELLELLTRSAPSQQDIAERVGISQALVSAILSGKKNVGEEKLAGAMSKLGLHHDYFCEERAGTRSYTAFLGGRSPFRVADGSAVYVPARSAHAEVEEYIAEETVEGRPVSAAHLQELRGALLVGPVTVAMAASLHREMIARDRAVRDSAAPPKSTVRRKRRAR